jgi:hypothetical protein
MKGLVVVMYWSTVGRQIGGTRHRFAAVVSVLAIAIGSAGCADECASCAVTNIVDGCVARGDCTLDGVITTCVGESAGTVCPLRQLEPGRTLGFPLRSQSDANDLEIQALGKAAASVDLNNATLLFDGTPRPCQRSRSHISCLDVADEPVFVEFRLNDGDGVTFIDARLQDSECVAANSDCGM